MRAFKVGRPPRLLVRCLGVMSVLAGVQRLVLYWEEKRALAEVGLAPEP